MSIFSLRNALSLPVFALLACCVVPMQAAIITLNFDGTYDTLSSTVFGQSGTAVPYHYSLTYDTSLNTNTNVLPVGASVGGPEVLASPLYGYSASGIVASSLTFGGHTFQPGDIQTSFLSPTVSAQLWFDTDLNVATPTQSAILFRALPSGDRLKLGGFFTNNTILDFGNFFEITEGASGNTAFGNSQVISVAQNVVPEPASTLAGALAACGMMGVVYQRRRKAGV